ncbi:DUF2285 domain-containing protein [Bradyrhizobium iriomotense]|uniref:T6SS Transcription factor RovC-like DNA binding domain-containing protein n=1 Tax=Bradyrhizobium iriomotense TaxID=441950 RepID=A0ABQ6B5L1_9BRAD|nr:DUF2285 domain-containing protein [Bradyrhizobium iriomotense]GLR89667.1 hypothetical protein GCM10007857_63810 [Bradyrhizobium iriomotense]
MPAVLPIVESAADSDGVIARLLADLASNSIRRADDGWHAVLRIDGTQHHLWLKQAPRFDAAYAIELPLEHADFEIRAHASSQFWRAITGRLPAPPLHQISAQQRERLALSLRALDGHMDGASYRAIAEVLFGQRRISERAWKTHELRSRVIRLVQAGLALMRSGYRALLRPSSRRK